MSIPRIPCLGCDVVLRLVGDPRGHRPSRPLWHGCGRRLGVLFRQWMKIVTATRLPIGAALRLLQGMAAST